MSTADAWGALARLAFPKPGDPSPEELVRALPGAGDLPGLLPEGLRAEHERFFGPSLTSSAPPYETCYGGPHVFMQSQQLADLAGFYRAFGLVPPTEERVDHLAVELEFMQALEILEEHAATEGREDRVEVCREAARRFLSEHLGRWVPALAGRLRDAGESPFYARYGEVLTGFVAAEAARRGTAPATLGPQDLRIPEIESDSGCGSCTLAENQA